MSISSYSNVASTNTTISGINIGEGCAPGNINDAIRQLMADLGDMSLGNGALGNLNISGAVTVNNINGATALINGGSNGVGNIGSAVTNFNTIFAKATSAQYADLAEYYVPDDIYTPGTVVVFDGEQEITASTTAADTKVAGVISTRPAFIMNSGAINGVPVALRGRVPVNVTGVVAKGDLLITSEIKGTAISANSSTYFGSSVFAKALEDKHSDGAGVIEAVIL